MNGGTAAKTAFVLAGGGSLGAVQVGMLRSLTAAGVRPDFIVGSSVGAMNACYFAGQPDAGGRRKARSNLAQPASPGHLPVHFVGGARLAASR
jgi:NTE family protein